MILSRLSDCSITEEGYTDLAEALRSNPSSHLKELDLRGNHPGTSGMMKLIEIQKDHKLETLRLLKSDDAAEALRSLIKIVGKNPLLHTQLDLNKKTPGDVKVKNLSALLQDPHYRLQELKLYKEDSIKDEDCVDLFSALDLNPSHLRELNLNENKPGESGLRKLCDFLKNPKCNLQKLQLQNSVSDESWSYVASALCTNPSHIRDLDLSECELGDSGVEKLCDLLKKHECKLQTLRLKKCSITDRGGAALTEALKLNSSHLKELDLRQNKLKDLVFKELKEILRCSGGQLQYDKSWGQTITGAATAARNFITGNKSDEQPTSKPGSVTVQKEQNEGKMQNQQRGSGVYGNLGSSVGDDYTQQNLCSSGTVTDSTNTESSESLYSIREENSRRQINNSSNTQRHQTRNYTNSHTSNP